MPPIPAPKWKRPKSVRPWKAGLTWAGVVPLLFYGAGLVRLSIPTLLAEGSIPFRSIFTTASF
jgi:hypothetical protein